LDPQEIQSTLLSSTFFDMASLAKWLSLGLLGLTSALPAAEPRQANEYEYIVVGSGAGGGPLASRLAREGHSTLLIEAGDDQSNNDNTTIPIFQ
jgi:choline dehydrogenase